LATRQLAAVDLPKCVKCDQQRASKDCSKPTGSPPQCTNCGGEHPANFTGCPQYIQQLNYIQRNNPQQRLSRITTQRNPPFRYQKHSSPNLSPQPTPTSQQSWAKVTSLPTSEHTQQSTSSVIESIREIIALFNFQQISTQMRHLAIKLQETGDPINKLVAVIDMVVNCLATAK
jgi:hypothetical protein